MERNCIDWLRNLSWSIGEQKYRTEDTISLSCACPDASSGAPVIHALVGRDWMKLKRRLYRCCASIEDEDCIAFWQFAIMLAILRSCFPCRRAFEGPTVV